jgi:hypothetical protein
MAVIETVSPDGAHAIEEGVKQFYGSIRISFGESYRADA